MSKNYSQWLRNEWMKQNAYFKIYSKRNFISKVRSDKIF